ncbi:hypothetical protein Ancab_008019, partial [Ancistrocladus abbreviatus]
AYKELISEFESDTPASRFRRASSTPTHEQNATKRKATSLLFHAPKTDFLMSSILQKSKRSRMCIFDSIAR